jgi:hypothetical protein
MARTEAACRSSAAFGCTPASWNTSSTSHPGRHPAIEDFVASALGLDGQAPPEEGDSPNFVLNAPSSGMKTLARKAPKRAWIPIDSVKRHEVSSTMKTAANFMRAIRGDPG